MSTIRTFLVAQTVISRVRRQPSAQEILLAASCVLLSEFNVRFTALGSQVAVTFYFCLNSLPTPSRKVRRKADPGV